MNYHNITTDEINNGEGVRVVLWVSGCSHHCNNCHNPETWDHNSGIEFDQKAIDEIFRELEYDYVDGITISGGDPYDKMNIYVICNLVNEIRKKFPNKTIWVYTGFTWEYIRNNKVFPSRILQNIDVLVDGKYVDELRDLTLRYRGSSNQRVIDCKASLESNSIVSYIPLEPQVEEYMKTRKLDILYKSTNE